MVHRMFLAGIPVRSQLILELAATVDDEDLGQKLRSALANGITLLGLDVPERETILRALEECPEGLGELRASCYRSTSGGSGKGSRSRLLQRGGAGPVSGAKSKKESPLSARRNGTPRPHAQPTVDTCGAAVRDTIGQRRVGK
jgi:hypothetical protein